MSCSVAAPVVLRGRATGRERTLDPLPASWCWTTVGDIAHVFRGASPRPKGDPRYFGGPIPWIMISDLRREPGKYLFTTNEGVTEAGAALSRRLPPGTLILSNSATVCVPKILKTEGCIHDGFVSFDGLEHCVSLDFAYWWFEFVRPYIIQENRQGVTQVNLNTDIVRDIHFPVPPRPEQDRIVAEIEKQFTRLDAAVAALKRVQANLKRYRTAVLKAACEGRLVPTEAELTRREGRSYEPATVLLERILAEKVSRGTCDSSRLPDASAGDLPRSPEGWIWISLGQLLHKIQAGKSFRCEERPPGTGEVGVVKVSSVTWGEFDELESKTCLDSSRFNENYLIRKNDFLFSRANTIELVGACVIVKDVKRELMLSDKILRFKLVSIPNEWVLHWLRTQFGRSEIERLSTGNQESMRNIGQERIKSIRIALPPLREISRIVAVLERRLSIIDEVEGEIRSDLKRAKRLRGSILKRAFAGGLAAHDPKDEPAIILLERIRAARASAKAPAKTPIEGRRKKESLNV
jgi:type I restriction enzyme, S subunit